MAPAKNPPELASAILELLGDPSLAEKFSQEGPLTAQEYTWEKVSDRMEAALLDFVTVPASRPSS
jgi:glycosyltransferase involved in cell wall biosynthesis